MSQVWHFVITCGDVACGDHLIIPPTFSTVVKAFPTHFTTLLDSSHTAFLFYLNIFSPTCLLSDYLNKCFQFTSKVPQNLSDDYNLLLIYPKETLSEIFLFFYVKTDSKLHIYLPVMYSSHLGDQYTCLVAQTLAPRKHFSSFHFSVFILEQLRI